VGRNGTPPDSGASISSKGALAKESLKVRAWGREWEQESGAAVWLSGGGSVPALEQALELA